MPKRLNIVARLIFRMGIPVHVIARTLKKSEIEVCQFLNGKKIPRKDMRRLKDLWTEMEEMSDRISG